MYNVASDRLLAKLPIVQMGVKPDLVRLAYFNHLEYRQEWDVLAHLSLITSVTWR